jgi:hypothetical protein
MDTDTEHILNRPSITIEEIMNDFKNAVKDIRKYAESEGEVKNILNEVTNGNGDMMKIFETINAIEVCEKARNEPETSV